MADGKGESRAGLTTESMSPASPPRPPSLADILKALEDALKEDDVSALTSAMYCTRFCEILMQHTENHTASENLVLCTEVYGTALRSFASARPYLTTECEDVLLLLKRLVLSCFEVVLSMAEEDLSCDLGLRLKKSIVDSHDILVEFGNNILQLLVDVIKNGGAWKNPVLVKILSQQPVKQEEVQKWISQEGSCFLQMRIKHLMKSNCVPQAMILSRICAESADISNDFSFRQSFITCLCTMLPNEEAFKEISKMDGKEVLDAICNLESEGQDNTAFILCTTYLTQQLQNEITSCSWELTLFWSKLQRRIDSSLNTFLERCRQFGLIAKTRQHLFFLIKVVHTEAGEEGVPVSIVLCIRALQIQSNETDATKTSVCKTIACLLPHDLEVRRACQLTEFLFEPTFEGLNILEELFMQPDQKNEEESSVISNSLRCELLLALKSHWVFDPEFWDWKTLKRHCLKLLGKEVSDTEEEIYNEPLVNEPDVLNASVSNTEDHVGQTQSTPEHVPSELENTKVRKPVGCSERYKRWLQYKFYCVICNREVIEARILHHAKMHLSDGVYTCPVCIKKFKKKEIFVPHVMDHMKMPMRHRPKKRNELEMSFSEDACESKGYISFKTIKDRNLQDRDVYPCPGTGCSRDFKQFKYLSIHLKAEHQNNDENAKHYLHMKNLRQKCAYCRRHFITNVHLKQHMNLHFGPQPFMCVSINCNARFKSLNELLLHKQSHSDPQYKCELEGCHLVFSDLGLLYHHEAQHFRDASYACTFMGCKMFYYSNAELQEHLATHGTSLGAGPSDENYEKREIKCEPESHVASCLHSQVHPDNMDKGSRHSLMLTDKNVPEKRTNSESEEVNYKQSDCTTPHNRFENLPSLENSLSSKSLNYNYKIANKVQINLQRIDHLQMKSLTSSEALCTNKDNVNLNIKLEPEQLDCSTSSDKTSSVKGGNDTAFSCGSMKSGSENNLNELLTSLKHLNLKNSNACITYSAAQGSESKASSSNNLTVSKTHSQKQEKLSQYLARLAAKPYFCELKGCKYAFVTKDALLLHYVKKHHFPREKALKLHMFQNKYSPFECHICQRRFTRRTHLRIHYKKKHHIGKERVNCRRGRRKLENKMKTRIITERRTMCMKKFQPNETIRAARERRCLEYFNSESYVDSFSDETDTGNGVGSSGSHTDDFESREGRGSRRVVAQGKLCYILNKYHKPFHCIHKSCNSSFTSQQGLVRHYRLVHQYNRESLCLEKDKTKTKSEFGKCRRIFTCKYKECRKSFICPKALSKHYIDFHNQNENEDGEFDIFDSENNSKHQTDDEKSSEETESEESEIYCDVEGCNAVFINHASYSQHILSRHRKYNLYEERRKRREEMGAMEDLQKNYVQPRRRNRLLYKRKIMQAKNKLSKNEAVQFKTMEEALQMCAQNVNITQFPCMIQGCPSVVKLESSIVRHYKLTHHFSPAYIIDQTPVLVHCVKNFQKRKKEQSLSAEVHSPKTSDCDQEHKIPKLHLHGDIHSTFDKREERKESPKKASTLSNPVERDPLKQSIPVNHKKVLQGCLRESDIQSSLKNEATVSKTSKNISPFTNIQSAYKINKPSNGSQKLLDSSSVLSTKDTNLKQTDSGVKSFKPMGFESSFLKFLQETKETDDELEDMDMKPPKQCKWQNSFQNKRPSCKDPDKINSKMYLSRDKRSGHENLEGFQPLLSSTGQSAASAPTLQALRAILDKALTDCGDLALKQLHYQRPVVVLERSKFKAPLLDLFSSKKTDELCLGIS
ncbi:zinc finger protein Rlf [Rhinophrynus dorsalis]